MLIPEQGLPAEIRELQQPLAPKRLVDLPPNSFHTELSLSHALACDAWYTLVESHADAGLHPRDVHSRTERTFAHAVHQLVTNNVITDANHQTNPILTREDVVIELGAYYQRFPPSAAAPDQERQRYQDTVIPYALKARAEYLEIGVILGLQRAFVARRLMYPARATYALLSAYGGVLRSRKTFATENQQLHPTTNIA